MKDGRTHLAHKEEHAVDMDTGVVVAMTLQDATAGDTSTLEGTLEAAEQNLDDAREQAGDESKRTHEPEEAVADKGYLTFSPPNMSSGMYSIECDQPSQHSLNTKRKSAHAM